MSKFQATRGAQLRRTTLALALGLGFAGAAFAQSTTGAVFGQAPAGDTVTVKGTTGVTREVTVDASGRYSINQLPLGDYTVTLQRGGEQVDSRSNVGLRVGGGTEVTFGGAASAANAQNLEGLTVSANSLPPIDVSSVDSHTTITSQDLARLPLARNAEAIALLAPGTVSGSGFFGSAVSFGGAGVTENAYYINGFNTTNPLNATGGVGLPYGAIEQQQILTGGYSAKYGRSDGGVINQVGKRGTNDWHFGAQVLWQPKFARADPSYVYYPNRQLPEGYGYQDDTKPGTIYRARKDNKSWSTTYSAYVGGPLIKDKLFVYLAAEAEKTKGKSTSSSASASPSNYYYEYSEPKIYAKLDWNINDSNIFELTGIQSNDERGGQLYGYDYDTGSGNGEYLGRNATTKSNSKYYIAKYTSYITDDLNLSVEYGWSRTEDPTLLANPSSDTYISGSTLQNPALNGGSPIRNGNTNLYETLPTASNKTHGLRVDLQYQAGDHQLGIGIDNMNYYAQDEGQSVTGPAYAWIYDRLQNPGDSPDANFGIAPPGGKGYFVQKYILTTTTSMAVNQDAYYLEDNWQVSDNVLLSLGIRDDKFVNSNNLGQSYIDNDNQWAPRLGVSWDVNGDSSLKLYANAGRYYLALPSSVAIRGASASTYTREYFTYSGIDANGYPVGPDGTPNSLTALGPGPVSANDEFGQPPDPKTVAATDLKSQYQDEVLVGADMALGRDWVAGAKATYRQLQTAIDDVCDTDRLKDKLRADGTDPDLLDVRGCYIFNPGETNSFQVNYLDGSGSTKVRMSKEDWGFTEGAKRKYYALDLYLEHPFDGKWQARVDYTFSRSYGNSEGQVKSGIGQTDTSKTQDWDSAELMINSYGLLANDRRHQLKMRGSYQVTPEWLVSGALRVQSGMPKSCLGYYFGETDPISYRSSYHVCRNEFSAPGDEGREPWSKKLDLAVSYRPAFADHKLAFGLDVFNVLNETKEVQSDPQYETGAYTVSNTYRQGIYFQTPRYVRLSASYDF